ncbi:unnamed protein product [Didymodactylos carnosus]|uniref:Aldehyde dehydrogenase n=1 Tax=Didymodactylos carnosus TaxID=1234261 RepID=A0A813SFA3_9BILA|nr:unnamed protein product [Didymodactylos carnosus]CAF0795484.1 unnamed protein product [Didymodactylos carnosus]CAF3516731.1 unnamed protein product [Didymodactylos carnosus]CAF3580028.1 unnamed protein product [Didymodactylos carnosus]
MSSGAMTAVESIPLLLTGLRTTFNSGKTKSLKWRKQQLERLLKLFDEQKHLFADAAKEDFHRPEQETLLYDCGLIRAECVYALNNIDDWVKDEKKSDSLVYAIMEKYVHSEPYGVSLIIGPWNYPFLLLFAPLVGSIAAGNCSVLKPSELAPKCAQLVFDVVPRYLDNDCIKTVLGGVDQTQALLKGDIDYIFYTGATTTGKIIMHAAAEKMIPVTLECGGKSPVYIADDANIEVTGKRIAWGKCINSGQTCVAPDYLLCSKATEQRLIPEIIKAWKEFYTENPLQSESYAHIVNDRHFKRVENLIDKSKVVYGGNSEEKHNYISPTIMTNVTADDKVMQEEIFGPLLPIINVRDENEAIRFINERSKPLALYVFTGNKKLAKKIIDETSSGSVCVNDVVLQIGPSALPFGGVGPSGLGSYHGKYSFDTFSHKRSVAFSPTFADGLVSMRNPPYTKATTKRMELIGKPYRNWFHIPRVFKTFWFWAFISLTSLDPKMDSGMSINNHFHQQPQQQNRNLTPTIAQLIDRKQLKIENFSNLELVYIFDQLLSSFHMWLDGHSLALTVFTCLYLHEPDMIKDNVLRTMTIAYLKLIDYIRERIILKAGIYEEEDFSGTLIYNFKFYQETVKEQQSINDIKKCEDDLAKYYRKLRHLSTTVDISQDMLYTQQLTIRMKFLRHLYQICLKFNCVNEIGEQTPLNGEEIAKLLKQTTECLQLIQPTVLIKDNDEQEENNLTTAINIQKLDTNSSSMIASEEESNLSTTILSISPSSIVDLKYTFDPYYNYRQLPPAFNRFIRCLIPSTIVYKTYNELCEHIKKLLEMTDKKTLQLSYEYFIEYSTYYKPTIFIRSLLLLSYLPSAQGIPLPGRKIFGQFIFSDYIKLEMKSFILPPILTLKHIQIDQTTFDIVENFFQRSAVLFSNLFYSLCNNRARTREKLSNLLEECSVLQDESEKIDNWLQKFLLDIFEQQTPNNSQVMMMMEKTSYFFNFMLHWTLCIMEYYIYLGFELDLYSKRELYDLYFYLAQIILFAHITIYTRADYLLTNTETFFQQLNNTSMTAGKKQQKSPVTNRFIRQLVDNNPQMTSDLLNMPSSTISSSDVGSISTPVNTDNQKKSKRKQQTTTNGTAPSTATNGGHNNNTNSSSSNRPSHYEKELNLLHGHFSMCTALHRCLKALEVDNRLIFKKKNDMSSDLTQSPYFLKDEVRYRHRFMPFSNLCAPRYMKYHDFKDIQQLCDGDHNIHDLYQDSVTHFQQAKVYFETYLNKITLKHSSTKTPLNRTFTIGFTSVKDVESYIKIAKTNVIVVRLLAAGHKRGETIDFDFNTNSHYPMLKL